MALAPVDPHDYAFAAISQILDQPEAPRPGLTGVAITRVEDDVYSRSSPGPFDAIRVKWTTRAASNDDYVVDETVGGNSIAVTSRRMTREAAIRFVDDRANEAQQRFDQLRNEMIANLAARTGTPSLL